MRVKEDSVKGKNMFNKKCIKNFLFFIYFITFMIYVIKPICFDVKLYIEAAQRAESLGGFPYNIFEAWEHKYILNRLLFYIIFKIANLFISADNIILFEIVVKAIYGILAIVIIKYFAKGTKSFFEKYRISESMVFGILYFSIIGSGIYFTLQTEMTALLIILIAIILVLKDKTVYRMISAFIISTLFWLKGVTLLNSIIILIIMILNKDKKRDMIFVICWSWIFLLSEIILIYYIEPNEIKNMYLATYYLNDVINSKYLANYFINLCSYNMVWIGLLCFGINIINHIKFKNIKLFFLEVFTWIVLIFGVYIQRLIYFYQIGLIIVAILFSIFIFLYYRKNTEIYTKKITNVAMVMLIIFVISITTINGFINEIVYSVIIYKNTIKNVESLNVLNKKIPDLKEGKILYIGNGLSSYYIKSDSYTNYVTTIFLSNHSDKYINSEFVHDLKENIKNYNGKYIIIDQIEFINKFRISDDIIKFIEENYHYKQSTNIGIYEYETEYNYCHSTIYERNY